MTAQPEIEAFHDPATGSLSYLVIDGDRRRAAIIDPVLDYEWRRARTSTENADKIAAAIEGRGLAIDWVLETHVHADHLSAGHYLHERFGGRLAIGSRIGDVQALFKARFGLADLATDGSQFDHLFADGESFRVGSIAAHALHVPGHTPACVAYLIGDALFLGDTLFMPDSGTARCDFPGGDAAALYASARKLYRLGPATRVFVCHDYRPGGRALAYETTIAAQRAGNIHINDATVETEFVAFRKGRDSTLDPPNLILPSLLVNLRGGRLPDADADGITRLALPMNAL